MKKRLTNKAKLEQLQLELDHLKKVVELQNKQICIKMDEENNQIKQRLSFINPLIILFTILSVSKSKFIFYFAKLASPFLKLASPLIFLFTNIFSKYFSFQQFIQKSFLFKYYRIVLKAVFLINLIFSGFIFFYFLMLDFNFDPQYAFSIIKNIYLNSISSIGNYIGKYYELAIKKILNLINIDIEELKNKNPIIEELNNKNIEVEENIKLKKQDTNKELSIEELEKVEAEEEGNTTLREKRVNIQPSTGQEPREEIEAASFWKKHYQNMKEKLFDLKNPDVNKVEGVETFNHNHSYLTYLTVFVISSGIAYCLFGTPSTDTIKDSFPDIDTIKNNIPSIEKLKDNIGTVGSGLVAGVTFLLSSLLKSLGLGGNNPPGPDSGALPDEDIALPSQEELDQHFNNDKGKTKETDLSNLEDQALYFKAEDLDKEASYFRHLFESYSTENKLKNQDTITKRLEDITNQQKDINEEFNRREAISQLEVKSEEASFDPEKPRTYPKTKTKPFDNRKALFGAGLDPISAASSSSDSSSDSSSSSSSTQTNLYQLSNADLVNKVMLFDEEAKNIKDQFNLLSMDQKLENISSFQAQVENIHNQQLILNAELSRRENINTSDWDVRAREEEDNLIHSPILTSLKEAADEDDVLTPRPSFSQVLSEDTLLFGSIPDLSLNNYPAAEDWASDKMDPNTNDNLLTPYFTEEYINKDSVREARDTIPGGWPGSPPQQNNTELENIAKLPLPPSDDSDLDTKL
jgi:hypothetical protein